MKILAWYGLISMTAFVLASIADDKSKPVVRVGSVMVLVPSIIFFMLYLFT